MGYQAWYVDDNMEKKFKIDPNSEMSAIKQIRDQLGISQAELAYRLGMTERNYGRWERGEHKPGKDLMALIKNLCVVIRPLGLTLEDLPNDIFL